MEPRTDSRDSEKTLDADQDATKLPDSMRANEPDFEPPRDQREAETQGADGDAIADKEKNDNESLQPVGFWDTSLDQVRKQVFIGWTKTSERSK